jgi:glycerol-3-phosphate acyltransferase PlsY
VLAQIIAGGIGYLVGSFPTAYFLVKWKSNVDIRTAGSGNVGTLNSYEVTNSKLVGVLVLVADLLKGVLSVVLVEKLVGPEFTVLASAGVGAVVGHNFPVWLKCKGGRGLATAAGVMVVLGWTFVALWCAVWFVGKTFSKDVNVGNAVATVVALVWVWVVPASVMAAMKPDSASMMAYSVFATVLMVIILMRLIEPVRAYFNARAT